MSQDATIQVVDACNRAVISDQFVNELREASVSIIGRTILISNPEVFSPFGFDESLREIVRLRSEVGKYPERLMMIETAADIDAATASGRTGFYVYFQSPEPILNQWWRLDLFRALGLRVLQVTYNQRSLAGDGCSETSDAGLSEFGSRLAARCNEIGITLDGAHCGPKTTRDLIEASAAPVLLSHTGAKKVYEHPRCKADSEILACAERGGVIGVAGMASLIGGAGATIDTVLDHIQYIHGLVGPDHVGIGLDFITGHDADDFSLLDYKPEMYQEEFMTGVPMPVSGLGSTRDIVNIRDGLASRGFSEEDLRKVMGGNFIRVFRNTWS